MSGMKQVIAVWRYLGDDIQTDAQATRKAIFNLMKLITSKIPQLRVLLMIWQEIDQVIWEWGAKGSREWALNHIARARTEFNRKGLLNPKKQHTLDDLKSLEEDIFDFIHNVFPKTSYPWENNRTKRVIGL